MNQKFKGLCISNISRINISFLKLKMSCWKKIQSVIKSFWHRSLVFSQFYQKYQFSNSFEGFTSDRCLFCLEVLERWWCRQIERWTSVVELPPCVEVKQNKPTINTTTVSSCFSWKTIRAEQQNRHLSLPGHLLHP